MSESGLHLFDDFDSELCLVGAVSNEALVQETQRLVNFLEHAPDVELEDVAYTCACSARHMPSILAVVASSTQDLLARLKIAWPKLAEDASRIRDKSGMYYFRDRLCPSGRIAFLFPGADSFYPDMLRDLCISFECCRLPFDEMTEAVQGWRVIPADHIFPPAACYRNKGSQPAADFIQALASIHSANTALFALFDKMGITPDGFAGFGGGGFAALMADGCLGDLPRNKRVHFMRQGLQTLERLVHRDDLPDCSMIAVFDLPEALLEQLQERFPGRIAVAIYNSKRQKTLAVSAEVREGVLEVLNGAGVRNLDLPSMPPFNTPWCSKILSPISQFLTHWIRHEPSVPLYSCATGERTSSTPRMIVGQIADQWTHPIRFTETVRTMYEDGYRIFIELGARGAMTTAIDEILKGEPHQAVAANRIHRSGLLQLHHALALLAAQGVALDATVLHLHRRQRLLNFDKPLSAVSSPLNLCKLETALPAFTAFQPSRSFLSPSLQGTAPNPAGQEDEVRRIDFGADFPMVANAEVLDERAGEFLELAKELSLEEYPFLEDYAIGSFQLSYSDPQLRGLTILSLISGLEMMCETARKLSPRMRVVRIDNLRSQRWLGFRHDALRVTIKAERISWQEEGVVAVRTQLRDDTPNSAYTWPVMEGTVLLSAEEPSKVPQLSLPPLPKPRSVNWSTRDIYPDRLFQGGSLQIIRHVERWSEGGIDFDVQIPRRNKAVAATHFPLFSIWPILLDGIVSSFSLWRSHERFAGAISLPFRARRIIFHSSSFTEGARLHGFLRLFSVTPRSHVADIQVLDAAGHTVLEFKGWEELCERVPPEYQQFILQPSEKFITHPLPLELLGNPQTPIAGSVVSNVPVAIFEHNQELWLKSLACVLLGKKEREEWAEMQGSTARRLEWLFGRAVAKEATRRFLQKYHQARWTAADIPIWPDDAGKPHPLGAWKEYVPVDLDLSIAHTSQLVVAAVAANARIGIDIEILGRHLGDEFTQGVFTQNEVQLAVNTGDTPTAILIFWCAKEAISKALGTGIRYSPRDLQIVSYDPAGGRLEIELKGQWVTLFKQFRGRKNVIYTSTYSGHAFASCVIPSSLFEGN